MGALAQEGLALMDWYIVGDCPHRLIANVNSKRLCCDCLEDVTNGN